MTKYLEIKNNNNKIVIDDKNPPIICENGSVDYHNSNFGYTDMIASKRDPVVNAATNYRDYVPSELKGDGVFAWARSAGYLFAYFPFGNNIGRWLTLFIEPFGYGGNHTKELYEILYQVYDDGFVKDPYIDSGLWRFRMFNGINEISSFKLSGLRVFNENKDCIFSTENLPCNILGTYRRKLDLSTYSLQELKNLGPIKIFDSNGRGAAICINSASQNLINLPIPNTNNVRAMVHMMFKMDENFNWWMTPKICVPFSESTIINKNVVIDVAFVDISNINVFRSVPKHINQHLGTESYAMYEPWNFKKITKRISIAPQNHQIINVYAKGDLEFNKPLILSSSNNKTVYFDVPYGYDIEIEVLPDAGYKAGTVMNPFTQTYNKVLMDGTISSTNPTSDNQVTEVVIGTKYFSVDGSVGTRVYRKDFDSKQADIIPELPDSQGRYHYLFSPNLYNPNLYGPSFYDIYEELYKYKYNQMVVDIVGGDKLYFRGNTSELSNYSNSPISYFAARNYRYMIPHDNVYKIEFRAWKANWNVVKILPTKNQTITVVKNDGTKYNSNEATTVEFKLYKGESYTTSVKASAGYSSGSVSPGKSFADDVLTYTVAASNATKV